MDPGQLFARFAAAFDWAVFLPLLLAVASLWGIRRAPKGEVFAEPLDRRQSVALRGVFACVIIFHHLTQKRPWLGILSVARFDHWGALAVSVFFGLSGYGLMRQLAARPDYWKGFLARRFKSLWGPYAVVAALSLLQWWRGDIDLVHTLTVDLGIVRFGWFCIVLFLFYVLFRWAARASGGCPGPTLARLSAAVLALTLVLALLRVPPPIYSANGAFLAGLFLGAYPREACALLKRHGMGIALMALLVYLLHSHDRLYWKFVRNEATALPVFLMNAFFFVAVAAFGLKWRLGNPVLAWLGGISYELYLCHGWVMTEIRHWWPGLDGTGYAYAVVAATLPLAAALHWAVGRTSRPSPTPSSRADNLPETGRMG